VSQELGHRVDEDRCQSLEDKLVLLQEKDSGRVKLSTLYKTELERDSHDFRYSPEFLRQQGLLDESDPKEPLVIIPNFMAARTNCLNSSMYYDLCCNDLCEDLIDELEFRILAPTSTPAEIMRILEKAESAYFPAGRNFSAGLQNKLQEVAGQHGGKVPIHGRLFAQWMHFAYPLECPYPHLANTIKPATAAEWFEKTGHEPSVTVEEMKQYINGADRKQASPGCDDADGEGMCMWIPEEELVDGSIQYARLPQQAGLQSAPPGPQSAPSHTRRWLRMSAFGAMLMSSAVVMFNVLQQMRTVLWPSSTVAKLQACLGPVSKDESLTV